MSNNNTSHFVHFMNISPTASLNSTALHKAMTCSFTDEETAEFTDDPPEQIATGTTPSFWRAIADSSVTMHPVKAI